MDPATVFTALAALAPAGQRRDRMLDVTGGRALVWLENADRPPRSRVVDRLAAVDVLHRDERLLRRGWAFVLGTTKVDGAKTKVRLPLLSEPVRLRRDGGRYRIAAAGDLELTPLVTDRELAARLESVEGVGSADWLAGWDVAGWLREAAVAAGVSPAEVLVAPYIPGHRRIRPVWWPPKAPDDRLVAIGAAGLYQARDELGGGILDILLSWAGRPGLAQTAFAAVYGADEADPGPEPDEADPGPEPTEADPGPEPTDDEVLSPLPLTAAQTEVVRQARTERVTVVSGPPGSGKSHALVAVALDVVDRGGSVLLATQSTHAADVLGELLDRYPGPTPVLFGDAEHRDAIATALAAGAGRGHPGRTLRADRAAVSAAAARVRLLSAAVDTALELERCATELDRWEPVLPALRADAPGAFALDADLDRVAALAEGAEAPAETRWQRLRRWSAERRLRATLGARPVVPLLQLRAAAAAGRASQAAAQLASSDGTDLAATWQALHDAEAALAETVGTAMRHRAGSAARWTAGARRGAAALASALRAGRNRRRQLLAGMDGRALVQALPLWVGTAADTGDLLPPVPGLFDLVILDEASHLDQLRAAPVLARARRAVVAGDPRQLRFVSFVADVDIAATLHRYGLDDRVDVRRMSAFDLAAGAAPVTWLDEHHRSVPHLIEFSADRFYGGRLTVATRHPANDSQDAIDVVRVPDGTVVRGVNPGEVEAAVAVVRELVAADVTGIAVISPFRAQVNALESALVAGFSVAELERFGLRVGTVHGFQGSEAHTVVASLGLTDDDSPARARFVADPHLFNVLVTRARQRMIVVTSLSAGTDGLVGDYLAVSEAGPAPPGSADPDDGWTGLLATELRRAGLAVRCDYPVGRWSVDLCVGDGADAVGLVCRVHTGGVAAHRQRQQAVTRAGWRLVDAFASRWSGDPVRAALDLATPFR